MKNSFPDSTEGSRKMEKNSAVSSEALKNTVIKSFISSLDESSAEKCFNILHSLAEGSADSVDCFLEPENAKSSPLEHISKLSLVTAPAAALLLSQQTALICFAGVFAAAAVPFAIGHFVSKKPPEPARAKPGTSLNKEDFEMHLSTAFKEIISLIEKEKMAGKEKNESSELCENKDFARWIQAFALFVINSENSDLLQLLYSLEYQLEGLGIYIYYKLDTRADGSVSLPCPDCFIDDRKTDKWTKVVLPAVFTKDKLLALGRII